MLTKGAIGNLVNRYRAVLTKCNLINTFGSLAVASMLVLGGAGVANAIDKFCGTNNGSVINETFDGSTVYEDIFGGSKADHATTSDGDVTLTFTGNAMEKGDIFGGSKVSSGSGTVGDVTINLNNGKLDGNIIGGGSAMGYGTATAKTGNVVINLDGAEVTETIIGGGKVRRVAPEGTLPSNMNLSAETKDVTINVKSGSVNGIVGGGWVNSLTDSTVTPDEKVSSVSSTAGDITINIYGGTVNKLIQGDDVGININDNQGVAIIGGGIMTMRGNTEMAVNRSVETGAVKINLYGGVVNGDIICGTIIEGKNTADETTEGEDTVAVKDVSVMLSGDSKVEGTIKTDSVDGSIVASAAQKVVVDSADVVITGGIEDADNSTQVSATGNYNDSYASAEEAVEALAKLTNLENHALDVQEGNINGAATKAADGTITTSKNELMDAALQQASVTMVSLDKILTNDVRKRLGDIRSDKNTTGVWMRWDGGKLKGDSGLTNNFNTIQIGGDTKAAKNCRIGFAGSFTHGDTEFSRGNGELEGFSFALYGTWMGDNGMFADVVARLGKFSTEMNVDSMKGDLDNRVASLSAEYGWRLPICQQFFVEPQVELAYTYVSSDDLQLGDNHYEFDSVDSLTGRAGVVAGWNLPDERGNLYARASVVQQFMGDAKISGSNGTAHNIQEIDGEDTWLEYGIGANVKLTDSTYLWADVERTEGADIEEEWRGTVGVRFSF